MNLDELAFAVKQRFDTMERTRALLRECDSLKLNGIIGNNPEK